MRRGPSGTEVEWIQSEPAHLVLFSRANAKQTTDTNKITLSAKLLNQVLLQNNSRNLVRSEKSIMVQPARTPLSNVSLSQPVCQRAELSATAVSLSISHA